MATRTFTVTVADGKFVIDGVSQDTVTLAEGGTYKFDQADSSNSSHPLKFSTTSDGTHGGGSAYTTGVTTSGTPGDSGAYTQILVAASAPTLYYYCANHSDMGGQANTVDADTWGVLTWGDNAWASDTITQSLTGFGLTASLGTAVGNTNVGWGSDQWGQGVWGTDTLTVSLTGVSASALSGPNTWGYNVWGGGAWQAYTIDYQISELPSGVAATASVGKIYPPEQITGLSVTASLGSISLNDGADHLQGLGGQAATASVGSLGFAWIDFPSGVSATASVGSISIASVELIDVTGVSATASVGSISPTEMTMGLTGVSSTASVGSISPTEMQMGLTGVSATASVADLTTASGGGIFGYADIDTGSNVTYTDVTAP